MKRATIARLPVLALAAILPAAQAAETFTYRLLPGKSTLHYRVPSETDTREIRAGVSGSFEFVLNDDDTITATAFDLTIEGPFTNGLLPAPDSIPFAPGDKLSDYLSVNFVTASGFEFTPPFLRDEFGPPMAVVGPGATRTGDTAILLAPNYIVRALDRNPTVFNFESLARADIGGTFRIAPEIVTVGYAPLEGLGSDVLVPLLDFIPNVARIPEPTTTVLFISAAVCLRRRRQRAGSTCRAVLTVRLHAVS